MQTTGQISAGRSMFGGSAGSKYRVLCSDGKLRVATITAEADTFFTLPARVSVKGRTVTGHVYVNELDYAEPTYLFTAYGYRKNADALPEWQQ